MQILPYVDVSRCMDFKNIILSLIFHELDSLDQNNLILGR